jgi:hypothetical protein
VSCGAERIEACGAYRSAAQCSRWRFLLRLGVSLADCLRGSIRRVVFRRVSLSSLRFLACGESIAFAVHLQDMNVMGKAVEERAGEAFRSEHARPFIERQIAGHQR